MLFSEKRWETDNSYNIHTLNPYELEHLKIAGEDLFAFLEEKLTPFYPGFEDWYRAKLIPGFINKGRTINTINDKETFGGVAITKHAQEVGKPNKISTFYIGEAIKGRGFGSQLLLLSLDQLRNNMYSNHVILTAPEEKVFIEDQSPAPFAKFLYEHAFTLIDQIQNKYRTGKTEYIFSREL